jgi:hypothetical protein
LLKIEVRVPNTFSTVFFDRPPVARYATKLCTAFVVHAPEQFPKVQQLALYKKKAKNASIPTRRSHRMHL